jgi:predicted phosphate transport protein (TIGR00153 family)
MAFPQEAEETIRRNILKISQEHARNVVEITRRLVLMFESIINEENTTTKNHYEELFKLIEQFDNDKKRFLEEVATSGALLVSREDFLRLNFKLNEIADNMEGLAFRLLSIDSKDWKVGKKFLEGSSKISSLLLEEVTKMRETLLSLSFNPSRALEMALGVEKLEKDVDSDYRALISELFKSKMPVNILLAFRDIIEHLETIADLTLDAIDLIRLLAISG